MCSPAVRTKSVMSPDNSRRERRLNAVIAKYLQAAESGRTPARQDFLERHWDLTDGLVSFFANEDCLKRIARLPAVLARAKPNQSPRIQSTGSLDDFPGRVALGEFELLNEIARGGMGVVYKARHKRLNRIVALKTIRPGGSYSAEVLVQRLRAEARVVAALDHPNIVPLYQMGEEAGCPYLILKLIPGGNLETHLPRLSNHTRAAVRLMAKVARAVEYAHAHGVLHRDLKPSNILVDLEGVPHVTDFGLARCVAAENSLTQTGLILGTPTYMAPEQVLQRPKELTEAVDVYGLGAVLYKLLARRPPFQAATMYEVLEQVQEREPVSLRLLNPAIDRDLDAI
jgi:serine/threonine protein kinase